jgi:16S rRNA (cytosine967-C5)-methyltransferase
MNPRLAALKVLQSVLEQGRNLPDALNKVKSDNPPLTQAMCYGVVRYLQRLEFFASQLLTKPLRKKDHDVHLLLLLGIYQLEAMSIPDHAAVSETVKVCKALNKDWARNLVNGVLRQFQRQQDQLNKIIEKNSDAYNSHPQWLLGEIQTAWPDNWQAIVEANNQLPPMTLRVNRLQTTTHDYQEKLQQAGIKSYQQADAPDALTLEQPCDVSNLPDFDKGICSVQDAAAQLAALLLDAQAGETILDACAAPGGKTAHILESQPQLKKLLALDLEEKRLQAIHENLARLDLSADVVCGDAAEPDSWWDGKLFDRILLDAPCSATGVIRRHPDIKILRRAEDIPQLIKLQQQILDQLWPLLKPGGMLIYATCSILPQENTQQVEYFLARQADARLAEIDANWGIATSAGRQILPGTSGQDGNGMDGFFYAQLYKQS